ncbi:ABC transporter ATP-binding protein [Methylovirgula sp. 4M-Z18]|nr:ABC transporter ATP-binding protein [Methylovirgula sp. 4M-Z18]
MPSFRSFWPSPLRPAQVEPTFSASNVPSTLLRFVLYVSIWDQLYLTFLSILVAGTGMFPIEMQRRIVNAAVTRQDFHAILTLAALYLCLVIAQGLLKLLTNIYRAWVGTNATRLLRLSIGSIPYDEDPNTSVLKGTKISMIIMEADAVGGFSGDCIAEPVLNVSILTFVFGYLFYLQPVMALLAIVIFAIQATFVPTVQRAINQRVERRISALRQAGADVVNESGTIQASYLNRFTSVFQLDVGIFDLKYTLNFLMNFAQHMGTIGVIVLGAWFVLNGRIQIGTVVAFLSGLGSVIDPWGDLIAWYQNYMVTETKYNLISSAITTFPTEVKASCTE